MIQSEKIKKALFKSAEYGFALFFWFVVMFVLWLAIKGCRQANTAEEPEVNKGFQDTVYKNDSVYVYYKELDTVYAGKNPHPADPKDPLSLFTPNKK